MKIIAFDLGKNFAWAHQPGRKVITSHFTIEGARAHRLAETMNQLVELLGGLTFGLDAVVYETPFARGRDATRSLWGIAGVIEACATNAGLPCLDVAVPTIKKFATGHGKASKEDMIAAARKFGYKGTNEHEADAVCLLRYAEANFERVRK